MNKVLFGRRGPMSDRGEMWGHGNAARVQFPGGAGPSPSSSGHAMDAVETGTPFSARGSDRPWTDVVGLPEGPGVSFRGKLRSENFFHFAVPTPVVVPSSDTSLKGVFVDAISVLWATRSAQLTHLWYFNGRHGHPEINTADFSGGTPPDGDFTVGLRAGINHFRLPEAVFVGQGIGISVKVVFNGSDSVVTFTGAGIHYQIRNITLEMLEGRR
jgi:hypothetical protein